MDSLSAHYQIVLTREGRLDEMEVKVEARPNAGADSIAVGRELAHRIKQTTGISARVSVLAPESIERSQGKARRVVDLRPKA